MKNNDLWKIPPTLLDLSDYTSPIEVFQTAMQVQVEDCIAKATQDVGINVDKDEIVKALKYDREQYDKGFRDGVFSLKNLVCCCDCVYSTTDDDCYDGEVWCNRFNHICCCDDFCSQGERRTE